jgi:hypothetical protein
MKKFTRREVLKAGIAGVASLPFLGVNRAASDHPQTQSADGKIPLIHITDLYHPPQDPDDSLDLATIMAFEEFDLKGVIFDITQKFLDPAPDGWDIPREPGYIPVAQMAWLTGRQIPCAIGPHQPLKSKLDTAEDQPKHQQAAFGLLFELLENASDPVVITLTGSARVLAAAWNRNPSLMREKISAVILNAGYTGDTKVEWNVMLDPHAYARLFETDLPIHWYPCATEQSAFNPAHERGVYWKAPHSELFKDLPMPLRGWLAYAFLNSSRGDIIRAMQEMGSGAAWDTIMQGERHMWVTASLALTAGRVLAMTSDGWRFLSKPAADGLETWPMRLDPIQAHIDEETHVKWVLNPNGPFKLFHRKPDREFGTAMTEATNALLKTLTAEI